MAVKVFSRSALQFDHIPKTPELVCLLGDPEVPGLGWNEVIETPEKLVVRPRQIPMRIAVVVMLVIGVAATVGLGRGLRGDGDGVHWDRVLLGVLGLVAVPVCLWLVAHFNDLSEKKGDYFRVNKTRRELELCQLGRTFADDRILAFTEVSRYCWVHREWWWTRQTGVLVRSPGGLIELHPVMMRESKGERLNLADRLAEIFRVPVQRVSLNFWESRALKDW